MDHPAPLLVPILNKLRLFMHLPTDPQNPNRRFLQCPATGHVYCMSTGSLYWKMPANISSLNQRNNSSLLPSSPALCTSNTFPLNTKNTDQLVHDNDASTTLSIENIINHKVKDADQLIQGNSASITQSNTSLNVKNADQHMQGNDASTIPNTQSNKTHVDHPSTVPQTATKVKHVSRPIQGISASIISNVQCNKNPDVKNADQPIPGISVSKTLNARRNKACKAKSEAFTQANSPVQGANSSMCLQSNSVPITEKKVRKRSRKTKDQSVPLLENPGAISKKKPASRKKNKSTVLPQPNSTRSFISYKKPASITQTTSRSKAIIHADNHLSKKNKRQSYTYYTFYLTDMIKVIQPMQIHFEHLLFPQNVSPQINLPKFSRKHAEENTENIQVCSLSNSKDKCSQKCRAKRSLYFSREDYDMMNWENNLKKKKTKKRKKKYGPVSDGFKNIWECLRPFNRRPHALETYDDLPEE
ncbi:uncharacterized protein LOC142760944 [Rhinoderma darwinii]|uniref:uncharacterized protein LOC142760944 n=1 Tax=Rhinoderma darwinii TaxID=43563 RepID=UPI003F6774AB